nr:unnamed protein product [Callosobruchus chinensis]
MLIFLWSCCLYYLVYT